MINQKTFSYLKNIAIIFSLCFIISCVDKIDFDVPSGLSESIAINGRLIKDGNTAVIKVTISNVFDFNNNGRRPVTVREPKLVDDLGNSLILTRVDISDYEAVIEPGADLQVEVGRSYSLEVALFDGRVYKSTFESLLPSPDVGAFDWEIVDQPILNGQGDVVIDKRLALKVSTSLETGNVKPGLLWEFDRVYKITDFSRDMVSCYVPENPNTSRVIIAEAGEFQSNELRNFEVLRVPLDRRITEGTLFNLKQYSLSPSAAKYWRSADLLLSKTGNMFDAPSSRIGSNFINTSDSTDFAYGYFFVTEVKEASLKVDENDIPDLGKFCDPGNATPENPCPFGCCNCLTIPESTLEVPAKWFQ